MNRTGDRIPIAGSYQHRALYQGLAPQRWWHALKLRTAPTLAGPLEGRRILDLGCGSGVLLDFIHGYQHYLGVDANADAIAFASNQYRQAGVTFHQALFETAVANLEPASIEVCFFLETIEHIEQQQAVELLAQIRSRLAPGGCLVLTTPNKKSLWPLQEKILDWSGLVPQLAESQHAYLYRPDELKKMLRSIGYRQVAVSSFNGIAPWLSFLPKSMIHALHQWDLKHNAMPGSLLAVKAIV